MHRKSRSRTRREYGNCWKRGCIQRAAYIIGHCFVPGVGEGVAQSELARPQSSEARSSACSTPTLSRDAYYGNQGVKERLFTGRAEYRPIGNNRCSAARTRVPPTLSLVSRIRTDGMSNGFCSALCSFVASEFDAFANWREKMKIRRWKPVGGE